MGLKMRVEFLGVPSRIGGIGRYAQDLAHGLEQLGISQSESPVVNHAVQPVLHPKGKSFVVTFHDLFPLTLNKNWWYSAYFGVKVRESLKKADAVLANSTQTAEELHALFPQYDTKVRMVNMGISDRFRPIPKPERTMEDGLVIGCQVGGEKDAVQMRRTLDAHGFKSDVRILSGVRDEDLVGWYNGLDYFADFGRFEGFGYCILEAQACGVCVLTLRGSKIPVEVKKNTVDADTPSQMAELMYSGLNTSRDLASDAAYARSFTVEKMVKGTVAVYEEVLGRDS